MWLALSIYLSIYLLNYLTLQPGRKQYVSMEDGLVRDKTYSCQKIFFATQQIRGKFTREQVKN